MAPTAIAAPQASDFEPSSPLCRVSFLIKKCGSPFRRWQTRYVALDKRNRWLHYYKTSKDEKPRMSCQIDQYNVTRVPAEFVKHKSQSSGIKLESTNGGKNLFFTADDEKVIEDWYVTFTSLSKPNNAMTASRASPTARATNSPAGGPGVGNNLPMLSMSSRTKSDAALAKNLLDLKLAASPNMSNGDNRNSSLMTGGPNSGTTNNNNLINSPLGLNNGTANNNVNNNAINGNLSNNLNNAANVQNSNNGGSSSNSNSNSNNSNNNNGSNRLSFHTAMPPKAMVLGRADEQTFVGGSIPQKGMASQQTYVASPMPMGYANQQTIVGNAALGQQTIVGHAGLGGQTIVGNAALGGQTIVGNAAFGQQTIVGGAALGQQTIVGNAMFGQQTIVGNAMQGQQTIVAPGVGQGNGGNNDTLYHGDGQQRPKMVVPTNNLMQQIRQNNTNAYSPRSASSANARLVLKLSPSNAYFQTVYLPVTSVIRVGRAPMPEGADVSNFIAYQTKVVSRNHAEIWSANGDIYIRDTKSQSGTFLNAMRLGEPGKESKPFKIRAGDILQFGVDFKGAADQPGGASEDSKCVSVRVEIEAEAERGGSNYMLANDATLAIGSDASMSNFPAQQFSDLANEAANEVLHRRGSDHHLAA